MNRLPFRPLEPPGAERLILLRDLYLNMDDQLDICSLFGPVLILVSPNPGAILGILLTPREDPCFSPCISE